jgi:hypothetical protein
MQALMKKITDDNVQYDSKANLFYYFYLFEAMEKTGIGNFTKELTPWKSIIEAGMTATPEKKIEQNPRSEVHPWTAYPVHFYFSLVAGIRPTSPGFKTVKISPMPGSLEKIKATYPTPTGNIIMDLSFDKSGKASGSVALPAGITGEFIWNGQTMKLTSGKSVIAK